MHSHTLKKDKALKLKSVLISQPQPAIAEKSPYYEIHTKYGIEIDYRPFIKVESVPLKEFRSQRVEILDHSAVVFTSRTSVDHFFHICEEARVTVPETMKYFCNAEAIALYLQKYIVYRKRKISFADGSFTGLMNLLVKHKAEKMLLILSEPHKPELPETMEKLKLNFAKVILSRAVNADLSDIKMSDYDIAAFFSPAEISSLTTQFGTKELPFIATFGDGTTRAAIDAGLTVSVAAPSPEAPSMAKAIDIFIGKLAAGQTPEPVKVNGNKQAEEFLKSQQAAMKKPRVRKTATTGNAK